VGLAAAIAARSAGLSVTVVEPRAVPVDKACGEGLMPTAVQRLARLGVGLDGRPFRGIRYVAGARDASALFRDGAGVGVLRTTLHAAFLARAEQVGVEIVRGRVDEPVQEADRVHAAGLSARWLLAADGLHSPVRRALGLDRPTPGPARYGQRRHFRTAPWTDLVEVHWAADAEAYVTPVGDDLVGVAVLGPRGSAYGDLLGRFPALQERLATASSAGDVRGAGPLRQASTARRKGRVLLVGDAAGYVDALTGEGIATGLATAEAAVAAVASGRPDAYERAWRQATRRYRLLTTALLRASQAPALRPALVPAAQRLPSVFRSAVNLLA
jgi:flavin-dependent dehydrogenase